MEENIRDYTAEDIKTLNGIEHIRLRAGMYIGSIEEAGLHHIFLEILSNSIDEYLNSSCDHISVTLTKNTNEIRIKDNGRGIPHGTHESGCSILEAVFGITNTGGKYNDDGSGGYNSTGGMNGIGAKATNALSEYFIAESVRDGKYERVTFNKGTAIEHILEDSDSKDHGVCITFKPDAEVLNVVKFNEDKIKKQMEEFSYLCKGLLLAFENENTGEKVSYYSKNGLLDYLNAVNQKTTVISEPCYFAGEGLEFAFVFNASSSYQYKLYTNNIPQLKGTHHTGFKTALTSEFNKYAKEKGLFKENDSNLQGTDLEEGQTLILSYRMVAPVYEGQNKENLTSAEARTAVQKIAAEGIRTWLNDNPKEAKIIIEKALVAKRAREAAKRARAAVKGKAETKKAALKMPSKLADAYSTDRSRCEIFIVEGDSAAGGMKDARNNEFQAILPIRGKILNTLKAPLEKILANAEIISMIDAFGLQLDIKTKTISFNKNSLRYGKIIIAADGDVDGRTNCQ